MNSVLEIISNFSWWLWILIVLAIVAIRDVFFQKKKVINK